MANKKRNRALLLKTAERIENIPESYDQGVFYGTSPASPCGTVACLAGEIVICASPTVAQGIERLRKQTERAMNSEDDYINTGEIAARLAGFTAEEGRMLFESHADYWPAKFSDQYHRAKTKRGRANTAAALLRYLADGGTV